MEASATKKIQVSISRALSSGIKIPKETQSIIIYLDINETTETDLLIAEETYKHALTWKHARDIEHQTGYYIVNSFNYESILYKLNFFKKQLDLNLNEDYWFNLPYAKEIEDVFTAFCEKYGLKWRHGYYAFEDDSEPYYCYHLIKN